MFFGKSKAKDEEIASLKKKIEELEQSKSDDILLFDEVNEVLLKFERGLYDVTLKNESNNPRLNTIKSNLNKALNNNADLADKTVQTLIEYGKANFEYQIDTSNLSGKLGSVILGIRALGSSISELLALLDTTSEELNIQMAQLSNSSNSLASASNQQAASLEETASALEEVTSTIINTTENTAKLALISEEVNKAAHKGEELASGTVKAMEDINNEVSSIESATKVIEQISFQTNILSLNAAVEAATAGEAGKGFAVVAAEVRNLATRSADAAKEITGIVNKAKLRAQEGKVISESMISGYTVLNNSIAEQRNILNEVTVASKEERLAIEQINDAVAELDQITQQNADAASAVSSQSNNIEILSKNLVDVVNKTTYLKLSREQVCDIELMFTLNRLKLDHINFKDTNYKQLDSNTKWTVKNETECALGKWIIEQERENKSFTRTTNWNNLKDGHLNVHKGVQDIINNNADKNIEVMLNNTVDIDKAIAEVFSSIQQVKRDNSKDFKANKVEARNEIVKPVERRVEQRAPVTRKYPQEIRSHNERRMIPKASIIESSKDADEWESF